MVLRVSSGKIYPRQNPAPKNVEQTKNKINKHQRCCLNCTK